MNTARKPVAVVVGATSKWQADGRNTKLAHGKAAHKFPMSTVSRIVGTITASLLVACATSPTKQYDVRHYLTRPSAYRLVEVLAERSDEERLQVATQVLTAKGIPHKLEDFSTPRANGKNLVFEYGSGRRLIVVSAHYDPPPDSPGANDDASCMASIIEAYEMLRRRGDLRNLKVRFIFFGAEELQRQGSKAYVRTANLEGIIGAASFEMCGIGDSVAVWSAEGDTRNSQLVLAIEKAAKDQGIHYGIVGNIPRYYSDHESFAEMGIPAVGVTIAPREDEAVLREYIKDPNAFRWMRVANRPIIFQTYHTKNDTAETISPAALLLAARIIYETALNLDSVLASNPQK